MTNLQNIKDVFSIFHDGVICEWTGNLNSLIFKVECQYLAELIDKSFTSFYINLVSIDKLLLDPWMNPIELPKKIKTELSDIFHADLDILSAKIEENYVAVSCNQTDISFDYCGGSLLINCKSISIFDQNKNIITIKKLDEICNYYWDQKFGKD
jgi:hypothetical protein